MPCHILHPEEPMSRRGVLAILAILAFIASMYCFSGYVMAGSFGAASDDPRYPKFAQVWGIATLVTFAVGLLFSLAAWKCGKPRSSR